MTTAFDVETLQDAKEALDEIGRVTTTFTLPGTGSTATGDVTPGAADTQETSPPVPVNKELVGRDGTELGDFVVYQDGTTMGAYVPEVGTKVEINGLVGRMYAFNRIFANDDVVLWEMFCRGT